MDFCTLFDSNYLTRGLALYHSLLKHCPDFHLYIIAFDDTCYKILMKLRLNCITVISLKEFENGELLKVKKGRTRAEYCWTCTSSSVLYCIEKFKLKSCTYLDADVFFYDDPNCLIDELEDDSVLITKHNYAKIYDKSSLSGIYCVQFVTFRNDKKGMRILRWWVDSCIKWCFNRCEEGKFGDQKYLDDWPEKFDGVRVLKNMGGGVAPWNSVRFKLFKTKSGIFLREKNKTKLFQLNFFHFHSMCFYRILGLYRYVTNRDFGYRIDCKVKKLVYDPYFKEIVYCYRLINEDFPDFCDGLEGWRQYWSNYKLRL